jgi:hypothetical protein
MQGKEPERGDPSGYAFGVKCSATLSGRRQHGVRFNEFESHGREATWFPFGKPTFLREKAPCDDAVVFGIGITGS